VVQDTVFADVCRLPIELQACIHNQTLHAADSLRLSENCRCPRLVLIKFVVRAHHQMLPAAVVVILPTGLRLLKEFLLSAQSCVLQLQQMRMIFRRKLRIPRLVLKREKVVFVENCGLSLCRELIVFVGKLSFHICLSNFA